MDLLKVRNNIDDIDDQLHSLILRRMKLSTEVAKCKLEENLPVFHPKREQEIIKRLKELSPKPFQDSVYNIYCQILSESKVLQRKLIAQWGEDKKEENETGITIACQGVSGSYSSIAAKKLYGGADLTFCDDFGIVFDKVIKGECNFGIVPIENTCAGSVTDNYDLLLKYEVSIVKTLSLQIDHCLLAKKGTNIEDIKRIYSHPQALSQCSDFFSNHKNIEKVPFSNTATAAKFVSESDENIGAIASINAKEQYDLEVLEEKIQNQSNNFTRFALISKKPVKSEKNNVVSIALRLSHTPSALYDALGAISKRGINMLRLQSRPIPICPFEFMFYIDFCGNVEDDKIKTLLKEIEDQAIFLKILGNYEEVSQ